MLVTVLALSVLLTFESSAARAVHFNHNARTGNVKALRLGSTQSRCFSLHDEKPDKTCLKQGGVDHSASRCGVGVSIELNSNISGEMNAYGNAECRSDF
jgi:hypothetical protein